MARTVRAVITVWALAGGAVLVAVVAMNVVSVTSAALLGRPFPGDFEMTEVGVAVAAFAFLPYCQLTGANVSADIFTSRAAPRFRSALESVAAVVAIGFSVLLFLRMWAGMLDQKAYNYTTAILQFPHWTAFMPILVSLALTAVAAAMTLTEALRSLRAA